MRNITYKRLKELVIEEATNLKKFANKDELEKLKFDELDSSTTIFCIYGLMTGHCHSSRSISLINKCATKFIKTILDGRCEGKEIDNSDISRNNYWSPIESFISLIKTQRNGNDKILIDFLKGETDNLIFK